MTSLFPHAAYEEDQPYARAILTTHVLRATFFLGSALGLASGTLTHLTLRFLGRPGASSPFLPRLVAHAGRGAVIGPAVGLLALAGRMRAREPIEWQDRAWRLQENAGQVRADRWTLGGAAVGAAA
ncbi:hypothetical protein BDY21DRAFT_266157, partial [Lineolata rhizophorae]